MSQQTNKGPVKVYEGLPNTDWDRNKESDVDVPVISHESGQRCVYPNFEEIKKYADSSVEARNFEVFRYILKKNGMLDQADDFFRASDALTVIEALLRYPKSSYFNDETFEAKAEVYNFSNSVIRNSKIKWALTDASGKTLKKGNLKIQNIDNDDIFPVGEFSIPLKGISSPQKLTVHLSVNNDIKKQLGYMGVSSGWEMGEVWINGEYMGSYWEKEKQQSIQIPAKNLVLGKNEVIVFNLKNNGQTSMKLSDKPLFR